MQLGDIVISSDLCIKIDRIVDYNKNKSLYGYCVNPVTFEQREKRVRLNFWAVNLIWDIDTQKWKQV